MLRTKRARIGLLIAMSGIATMGASLFVWTRSADSNRLYYTVSEYKWVVASESTAPAIAKNEVWHASAECLRPFYTAAVQRAKARLLAHNKSGHPIHDAKKQRSSFEKVMQQTNAVSAVAKQKGGPLTMDEVKALEEAVEGNSAFMESEWFSAQFVLEFSLKEWEGYARTIEDREILYSDVRDYGRNRDILRMDARYLTKANTDKEREDIAAKHLLKLSPFSDDEAASIRAACVRVIPLKRVVASTSYHTDLSRWPVEHALTFWFGLASVILGILFNPIIMWIGSGEA